MPPLAAADLLAAWEAAAGVRPLALGAVALLAAAEGGSAEALARLSIGRRNACLLRLRERAFGTGLPCTAACPACGLRVELALTTTELRGPDPGEEAEEGPLALEAEGHRILARLPDSRDLAGLEAAPGQPAHLAERALLARCLLSAEKDGEGVEADRLPEAVVRAISAAMGAADPLGEMSLALECPVCLSRWMAPLDPAQLVWREVDGWANRLLREVHALASAYGWSEGEILALSPDRRARYLELLGE